MNIKRKNTFLLTFFIAIGIFFAVSVQKVSAAENVCKTPGTSCTDMAKDGKGWRSPDGMECWYENVCPRITATQERSCCRDLGSVTSTTTGNKASNVAVTGNSTTFTNPLRFKNVEEFLGGILSAIQKIIVVLALVFIMIGAVMILTSAGSSGMVEKGKSAITMALIGLALGVAAPSLLKELSNIVGWGEGSAIEALTLSEIAVRVLNFLLGTMGIVALIMLVIGGIMYLTSAGDEDRIDKGKEIFKYSLIGILVAMSAMVLVTQVARFFQ